MDAVRNVKERGERDWKRLFNKFQEQDSEARVRVLLVALLPNTNFHISIHLTSREALVAWIAEVDLWLLRIHHTMLNTFDL